jgi:hypothetical protein
MADVLTMSENAGSLAVQLGGYLGVYGSTPEIKRIGSSIVNTADKLVAEVRRRTTQKAKAAKPAGSIGRDTSASAASIFKLFSKTKAAPAISAAAAKAAPVVSAATSNSAIRNALIGPPIKKSGILRTLFGSEKPANPSEMSVAKAFSLKGGSRRTRKARKD